LQKIKQVRFASASPEPWLHDRAFEAPKPTESWIPLREAAQGTLYSQEYLSLLARLGRIEAIKRGKIWYTTHQAILTYRESTEKQP
jgi:hypothetical protein